jgi:hypothetical protein
MSVPILAYQKIVNVNGAQDLLSNLRTFAIAQGWTSEEYLTGRYWVNGVGYTTGGSDYIDFLQLFSNGYGNQQLRYRFEGYSDQGSEPTVSWFNTCPTIPGNPTYTVASATRGIFQNQWQDGRWYDWNMPNSVFPAAWFFGLGKRFLLWFAQITSEWIICGGIGTIELLPEFQSRVDDWQMYFAGCYSATFPTSYWYNIDGYASRWNQISQPATNTAGWKQMYSPAAQYSRSVWTDRVRSNLYMDGTPNLGGYFGRLHNVVRYNSFTNKHVGIMPTWFYRDFDSGQWHVIGTYPAIIINNTGFGFGETLLFGTDEYLVFPSTRLQDDQAIAFRIS